MDNTNNKEYWENYTDYWVERVKMTNDNSEKKDRTLDDKILEIYLNKLEISQKHKVLDFGCGFCRIYPYYKEIVKECYGNYRGVDIAEAPLKLAEKVYPELKLGKQLLSYEGEKLPYEKNVFDRVICFGVFDACNQEKTLNELLRILKQNGRMLFTGKNDLYYGDDEAACIAEINARKKGHPNYFTDVEKMITYLEQNGVEIKEQYYFERRGDFSVNKFVVKKPKRFYEWALIIEKIDYNYEKCDEIFFSNKYSKTYMEKNGGIIE